MKIVVGFLYFQTCSVIICVGGYYYGNYRNMSSSVIDTEYRLLHEGRQIGGINPGNLQSIDGKDLRKRNSNLKRSFTKTNNSFKCSTNNVTKPHVFDWITMEDQLSVEDTDLEVEDKRREDAYQRLAAEKSPYSILVVVQRRSGAVMLCTGSLLTTRWVLTAAHCLVKDGDSPVKTILYAGGDSLDELRYQHPASGSQIRLSTEYYIYPTYIEDVYRHDVALVKSIKQFLRTKTVNVAELSKDPWRYKGSRVCSYTGYGLVQLDLEHTEDSTRKTQQLEVESPCHCAAVLGDEPGQTGRSYLCSRPAKDYGVCSGDSGGGLVCDGRVVGVAVQIVQLKNTDTCEMPSPHDYQPMVCGGANTFSMFENSCQYVSWINTLVKLYRDEDISDVCRHPATAGHDSLRPATPLHLVLSVLVTVYTIQM